VIVRQQDRIVGYMMGMAVEGLASGRRGILTPEWAHGAMGDEALSIYDVLYKAITRKWVSGGFREHAIRMIVDDQKLIDHFIRYEYGIRQMDAVTRTTKDLVATPKGLNFRPITRADHTILQDQLTAFLHYLSASPVYQIVDRKPYEQMQRKMKLGFVVERDNQVIASVQAVEAPDRGSVLLEDGETLGVFMIFTHMGHRESGIGDFLIKRLIREASEAGYKRVSVTVRTANRRGRRFFLRYFDPISYELIRHFDERL
jgi:ribosomal protein S18 acetylase RimI-like enzyme